MLVKNSGAKVGGGAGARKILLKGDDPIWVGRRRKREGTFTRTEM